MNIPDRISLSGLKPAPSQVWGAIRMVPLLRENVRNDLRLAQRAYDDDVTMVSLHGELLAPGLKYFSYVPHGLVLSWSNDSTAVASAGAQIGKPDGKKLDFGFASVRVLHRMVKREAANQVRMLPLHLAMEGFLSLFFSGPSIAWSEYSKYAISHGLGFRIETTYGGRSIGGLEDALRVFEIHPGQAGILLFVAEALACAFVVPSPDDYQLLHYSLLEDFFGELLYHYGLMYTTTFSESLTIDDSKINNLSDLTAAVGRMRTQWNNLHELNTDNLLQQELLCSKPVYQAGPFSISRFITDLKPDSENHLGECILRDNGELEYLKTYRLSRSQTRRAYVLSQLAEHDWNLARTAEKLNCSREDLILRIKSVGFGYLLNNDVLQRAAAKRK